MLYTWIKNRTKRLLIPYFVYSVVWIVSTYFVLDSSLELLKKNIIHTTVLYGCGALWFLPAMLISEIIFLVLRYICMKENMRKVLPTCVFLLFGTGVGLLQI